QGSDSPPFLYENSPWGYGKDEFFKWGQKRGRDVFFALPIQMKNPNKTLISSGFIICESAGLKQIILFHREEHSTLVISRHSKQ
ncbi:hypothetical protein ACQRBK_05430, partial [Peptoniphilaceae bacterium SGI.137]